MRLRRCATEHCFLSLQPSLMLQTVGSMACLGQLKQWRLRQVQDHCVRNARPVRSLTVSQELCIVVIWASPACHAQLLPLWGGLTQWDPLTPGFSASLPMTAACMLLLLLLDMRLT